VLLTIGGRSLSGPSLILAGVALSSLSGALMSLTLTLAPNPFALAEITFWLLGGLEDRACPTSPSPAPPILLGFAIPAACRPRARRPGSGRGHGGFSGSAASADLTPRRGRLRAGGRGERGRRRRHRLRGPRGPAFAADPGWASGPQPSWCPSLLIGAILLTTADMLVACDSSSVPAGLGIAAFGRADGAALGRRFWSGSRGG